MHGHGKIGKVPVSDTYTARSDTDTNVSNMHPAKKICFFIPGTARTRPDTAEQKKKERERTVEKPGILSGDPRTVDPPRR